MLAHSVRVGVGNGKPNPFADVIARIHAHHCDLLRAYRESTGGRYVPHTWTAKERAKIRVQLKARGAEQGEADFRDAISGLFASEWHREKNALTIQSVLNGTQLDRLADEYRSGATVRRGSGPRVKTPDELEAESRRNEQLVREHSEALAKRLDTRNAREGRR